RSSCVGVGDGVQPTGVGVDADHGPVTVAQPQGCGGFPLVVEAVHLVEFDAVPAGGQCSNESAGGVDGPDLGGVANEDDFGSGVAGDLGQGVQVEGGCHRSLIDHQDGPGGRCPGGLLVCG